METERIVRQLAALAQEGRLAAFRLLVRAEPAGMAAGELARALAVPPNTLSAQLAVLTHAGLVMNRRHGRSIRYRVALDAVDRLVRALIDECCAGRPELCLSLVPTGEGQETAAA